MLAMPIPARRQPVIPRQFFDGRETQHPNVQSGTQLVRTKGRCLAKIASSQGALNQVFLKEQIHFRHMGVRLVT